MITVAVLLASMLFTGSAHAQQSCRKASGDCLEAHGLPGCVDEPCCESICGFDPFCCDEWDADCAELADLTCAGLCGATASGSCFFPNGSPACDDRTCCQAICLTDPFCCAQIWDANCSLFAGFICEIPGGDCGDQGTGDCFEANGSPSCEDAECCESVCAIDSSCCEGVWDALCVALAEQACGGVCVVGTSESDLVEAEGCDGPSNDPCAGGIAEIIPTGARIHGTFASEQDVDVLSLDSTAVDLDGDGFVRVRMLFTANAAILKLRGVGCDSTAEFEIASSACLPAVINQCVPVGDWIMEITPTGAGLGCEDPAWRLELEVADTCGPICGRPDSCLQPHVHPGCSDSDCCQMVCQQDPACCDWTWDSTCALQAANLCGGLDVSPPDAEDLADLASRKAWGDENRDVQNPAPQLQLSAKLVDAVELPPRLMLETQAKRLGLRVLPDATASAIRAYLLRCGARPVCEEYFVDDVYRTAFDKDDYSTVQLEVLIN